MDQVARLIRKAQGQRSLYAFAEELGIHPATLSLIYSGRRGVGRQTLSKVIALVPAMADQLIEAFFYPET